MLLVFAAGLGIVIGAQVAAYRTVSSVWGDIQREMTVEVLLDEAKDTHAEAARLGQEAVATNSPQTAELATQYDAQALREWDSYASVVEEVFVEETLPGQSVKSIEALMREAQALRARVTAASLSGQDVAQDQQALAARDSQLAEYLDRLADASRHSILAGYARADSALAHLLVQASIGVALAAATVVAGAVLVYRRLRKALLALVRERDRSEILAKEAQECARHDQLTCLLNRLALMEDLESELRRARRYGHHVGLALLDIDGFKKFNDTFGHVAGDRVLKGIAQALLGAARQTDRLYRYGGDEFILVMPETAPDDVPEVVERLRDGVQQARWATPGKPSSQFAISVSAGTATFPADGSDIDSLIRTADKALYAAKRGGLQRKRAGARSLAAPA